MITESEVTPVTTATVVRSAFRVGMVVQRHPDTNPGMDQDKRNDRGTVLAIRPYGDAKHIECVTVLWESVMRTAHPDKPISAYGREIPSSRLRRVSPDPA